MKDNIKDGLQAILNAVNNLIEPKLENLRYDKTYRAKVISSEGAGFYGVQINGKNYKARCDNTGLTVGQIVKVKAPLNNFSDIYIEGASSGAESGTDYKIYNTYSDMITDTKLAKGEKAKTLGYYKKNDGGSAEYIITDISDSSKIQELLNNNLYAELMVYNNTINILQLGAKSDGTVDIKSILERLLEYKKTNALKIYIPNGKFLLSKIEIPSTAGGLIIEGYSQDEKIYQSNLKSVILAAPSSSRRSELFKFTGDYSDRDINKRVCAIKMRNLCLNGNGGNGATGIYAKDCSVLNFENIELSGFTLYGMIIEQCWDSIFKNIFIHQCGVTNTAALYFFNTNDNNNALKFYNCRFESNSVHILTKDSSVMQTSFFGCKFEDNNSVERIGSTILINGNCQMSFVGCMFNALSDFYQIGIKGVSTSAYLTPTVFNGCSFNSGSNGKYIKYENSDGGTVSDCIISNLSLDGSFDLGNGTAFTNNTVYLYHSIGDTAEGILKLHNKTRVIGNLFISNLDFATGSYVIDLTSEDAQNCIIRDNSFRNFSYTCIYSDLNKKNNQTQSFLINLYNINNSAGTVTVPDVFLTRTYVYSIQNGNIETIKNGSNGDVVSIYINTTGVTSTILGSTQVSLDAGKVYSFIYIDGWKQL